jgi:hypothetical protein
VVELPFAADCCPCVDKLRTVLPLTVGIRDGVVLLVSTLGSAVRVSRDPADAMRERPRSRSNLLANPQATPTDGAVVIPSLVSPIRG